MSLRLFSRMLPHLEPWANYIFRDLPCEYRLTDLVSSKVAYPLCRKATIVCRKENGLLQYWSDRQNPIAKPYLKVFWSLVVRYDIIYPFSSSIAKIIDLRYTCGREFARKRVLLVVPHVHSKSHICPTLPKWQHSWKWSRDSIKEVSKIKFHLVGLYSLAMSPQDYTYNIAVI